MYYKGIKGGGEEDTELSDLIDPLAAKLQNNHEVDGMVGVCNISYIYIYITSHFTQMDVTHTLWLTNYTYLNKKISFFLLISQTPNQRKKKYN